MRYLGARWIRTSVGGSVSSLTNLPETSLPGAGMSIASYKQLYDNAGIRSQCRTRSRGTGTEYSQFNK